MNYDGVMNYSKIFLPVVAQFANFFTQSGRTNGYAENRYKSKVSSIKTESFGGSDELTVFVKSQFRELSKKNLAIPVKLYNL